MELIHIVKGDFWPVAKVPVGVACITLTVPSHFFCRVQTNYAGHTSCFHSLPDVTKDDISTTTSKSFATPYKLA
jgi:hypothetical protein